MPLAIIRGVGGSGVGNHNDPVVDRDLFLTLGALGAKLDAIQREMGELKTVVGDGPRGLTTRLSEVEKKLFRLEVTAGIGKAVLGFAIVILSKDWVVTGALHLLGKAGT